MIWKSWVVGGSLAVALMALWASGQTLCAQQTLYSQQTSPRPYDGIQAGIDSYRLGEEQRRAKLGTQLYLNDAFGYRSFAPVGVGITDYYRLPVDSVAYDSFGYGPIGYGAVAPAGVTYSAQTYSSGIGYGSYRSVASSFYAPGGYYSAGGYYGATVGPAYAYPASPSIFSSYIYPTAPLVRQPIGRREVQTGPNRWESYPVYETPIPNYQVPYTPEPIETRPAPDLEAPPPPAPEPVEGPAASKAAAKPVKKPRVSEVRPTKAPPAKERVTRREF